MTALLIKLIFLPKQTTRSVATHGHLTLRTPDIFFFSSRKKIKKKRNIISSTSITIWNDSLCIFDLVISRQLWFVEVTCPVVFTVLRWCGTLYVTQGCKDNLLKKKEEEKLLYAYQTYDHGIKVVF